MNFSNVEQKSFVLKGNGQQAHMRCKCPEALKTNLLVKRLSTQSVFLTTSSIPRFIPLLATEARKQYQAGATTTNWDNLSVNGLAVISNTDYFINLRKIDNTTCYTSTLFWSNVNNIKFPPVYLPDPTTVFYLPYYYCYDITRFFDMVALTINTAIAEIEGSTVDALIQRAVVIYDAESDTVSVSIPFYLSQYQLEFSPTLAELFGFVYEDEPKGTYITKSIVWSPITVVINGYSCLSVSAKLQKNLFPFDLFAITADLPLTQAEFSNSDDPVVGDSFKLPVVYMWREENTHIQSGVPINEKNKYIFETQITFEEDKFGSPLIQFRLILRTKKSQNWIEWVLPIGEQLEICVGVYKLF